MDTEEGTVQKIQGGWAWVETLRKGGCENCSQKGHCNIAGDGTDRMVVKADNAAQARSGDVVEIYLSARTRLKSHFIVYLLPVLAMMAGAILGVGLSKYTGWNENVAAVLVAFVGLGIAFLSARVLDKRMEANRETIPIVRRIMRRADTGVLNPRTGEAGGDA